MSKPLITYEINFARPNQYLISVSIRKMLPPSASSMTRLMTVWHTCGLAASMVGGGDLDLVQVVI